MEEAEAIFSEIQRVAFSLFDGANKVLKLESCGGVRRKDEIIKDIDILIPRDDDKDTRFLLLKLVEKLESEGIIIFQLKEIRTSANGAEGFQGVCKLPGYDTPRRIDLHVYPKE
jgi:DNA polymerase/3'-5' exonuclease PolX